MQKIEEYISPSGQLTVHVVPEHNIVGASYKNLTHVSVDEYISYMKRCGELAQKFGFGKLFLDLSEVRNFSLPLRAAGVNNMNGLMLQKMPFFLLAIAKGPNTFDNIATQTAMNLARPLSTKFIDGKMFSTPDEAITWLKTFEIPAKFANTSAK